MPRDDRPDERPADALPVTLSVTLAAGTTLIAFATLAMSSTPVLHMIGITVAIGATVALVVSMALAPERRRAPFHHRMKFDPVAISAYTATTAVGRGHGALLDALRTRRSGLKRYEARRDFAVDVDGPTLDTWIGEVEGLQSVALPEPLSSYDCRNNRLAWLGLHQDDFVVRARAAVARYGAERVAVIIGTSTSGIAQAESAYRERDAAGRLPESFSYATTLNNFSAPALVAHAVGATGPTLAISTACSSSAKVFAAAARLMRAGWIDAAIVGGVDSLCLTTLCGFSALELLSPEPCRPFDRTRRGISIGEGAGFALLEARARRTRLPARCRRIERCAPYVDAAP